MSTPASRSLEHARRDPIAPLRLADVVVTHRASDAQTFRALDIPRLTLAPGASLGLSGPSGSGKTTFLQVVAGLLRPDAGRVLWGDEAIYDLSEARRDMWRRRAIGFVFQDFHLIPELSVLDNITLPTTFAGLGPTRRDREQASNLAREMGLSDLARRANLLSRGEQQRVAIARAILLRPALILADEPTASLDGETAPIIAALLVKSAREIGATLICASHDQALLARLGRRLDLRAGAPTMVDAAA